MCSTSKTLHRLYRRRRWCHTLPIVQQLQICHLSFCSSSERSGNKASTWLKIEVSSYWIGQPWLCDLSKFMKLAFENYGNDINSNKEAVWLGDKPTPIIGVVRNSTPPTPAPNSRNLSMLYCTLYELKLIWPTLFINSRKRIRVVAKITRPPITP